MAIEEAVVPSQLGGEAPTHSGISFLLESEAKLLGLEPGDRLGLGKTAAPCGPRACPEQGALVRTVVLGG